jgi:hypothetical protein
MNRIEKMERDETIGALESFSDRFRRETGRSVVEAAGIPEDLGGLDRAN